MGNLSLAFTRIKRHLLGCLSIGLVFSPVYAIYAPVPVVRAQGGKPWFAEVSAGIYLDDNIFGAAANTQDSWVGVFGLDLGYEGRINRDQTGYQLVYESVLLVYDDRPGDTELDNHILWLAVDHQFSDRLSITLSDRFAFINEPDASIGTTTLQTDQSSMQNIFNVRLVWDFHERFFVVHKYRNTHFNFDAPALKVALDRTEHLYGFEFGYIKREQLNIIGEYRLQIQHYRDDTIQRDSDSHFFLVGTDYTPGAQTSIECRVGVETRDREEGENTTDPFAEIRATYDYTERNFVSVALRYALIETSDTGSFTDSEAAELEANVSHYLTDMIAAGASVSYAMESLLGRTGVADVDENTLRFGVSMNYEPRDSVVISVTYDYDQIYSETESRDEVRNRVGLQVGYAF